jgi:phospholipid/cholesterol/gamma-HCH transport system substrate-binding protein
MSGLPGTRDPARLGWEQVRTGVLLLGGLALLLAAIFVSDIVAREITEGPRITVAAEEARDLEPGSGVWVAGVPAGRVTAVRFREPGPDRARPVMIRAVLRESAAGMLRADASASIRASALLAPSVVDIDPGSDEAPRFDFTDTLVAVRQVGQAEIQARADSVVQRLRELEPLARRLGERLTDGPGTLAMLARDSLLRERLARASESAARLMEEAPEGSAARLAADTALAATLRRSMERLREMAPSGGPAREGAAPDSALAAELAELSGRLERLRTRLETGRGTWGRVLHDRALDRERRLLEARMDSVRTEILSDPFRWIRFRLF